MQAQSTACLAQKPNLDILLSSALSKELLELVPLLSDSEGDEPCGLHTQVESRLVEILVAEPGVTTMVKEFTNGASQVTISQVAQALSSIPDRVRPGAITALRSPSFIVSAVCQLLSAVKELPMESSDGSFTFVAEVVARFCRRGYPGKPGASLPSLTMVAFADLVASEVVSYFDGATLRSTTNLPWRSVTASMKDLYALERFSEALLIAMEHKDWSDENAYHMLELLFGNAKPSIRSIFSYKFLLCRTFSKTVLIWLLNFSVFGRPSDKCLPHLQMDVVQSLAEAWAEVSLSDLTAALGMSMKELNKELLSSNILKPILDGISKRLESPLPAVRKMAKQMALAFSTVIDPENPLLLDDEDTIEELSRWDIVEKHAIVDGSSEKREGIKASSVEGDGEDDNYSEGSLRSYDMPDDDEVDLEKHKYPSQLSTCITTLRKEDNLDAVERALEVCASLVRCMPVELDSSAADLVHALVHLRCGSVAVEGEEETAEQRRHAALVAVLVCSPLASAGALTKLLYSPHVDISQRLLVLEILSEGAKELASGSDPSEPTARKARQHVGPWKETARPVPGNPMISLAQVFERELPAKTGQRQIGKSRRWAPRSLELRKQVAEGGALCGSRTNKFASVAEAFMLPVMRDYDKRSHGVDFVGQDYIVLGRLIYMLGVCMECVSFQPEALPLGTNLLDMLRSRPVATHPEPYVRTSVLFAASRVLIALHPSQVLQAEGPLLEGLEWLREWASHVVQNDSDVDCSKMAIYCLQLHSDMAYESSRATSTKAPAKTPLIVELL